MASGGQGAQGYGAEQGGQAAEGGGLSSATIPNAPSPQVGAYGGSLGLGSSSPFLPNIGTGSSYLFGNRYGGGMGGYGGGLPPAPFMGGGGYDGGMGGYGGGMGVGGVNPMAKAGYGMMPGDMNQLPPPNLGDAQDKMYRGPMPGVTGGPQDKMYRGPVMGFNPMNRGPFGASRFTGGFGGFGGLGFPRGLQPSRGPQFMQMPQGQMPINVAAPAVMPPDQPSMMRAGGIASLLKRR